MQAWLDAAADLLQHDAEEGSAFVFQTMNRPTRAMEIGESDAHAVPRTFGFRNAQYVLGQGEGPASLYRVSFERWERIHGRRRGVSDHHALLTHEGFQGLALLTSGATSVPSSSIERFIAAVSSDAELI